MQRRALSFLVLVLAASALHAQTSEPSVSSAREELPSRIAPIEPDQSIYSTKASTSESTAKPAIAPVPFGRGESSGAVPSPEAVYQPKIPFGRAEPSGPVIPSAPHKTEAVPVVGVDSVEASEAAPPTPVAPEADPVQQDPEVPTELTSPIFEPEQGILAPRKIVIRVLNKVTTQAQLISFKPKDTSKIGQLQITAITCQKSSEKSQADAAGLLEIGELPSSDKEKIKPLFRGWMYASSPSVTALEHPIYDVTMVRCEMVGGESADSAASDKQGKKDSGSKADKKTKKPTKR
jgi:hypothetical protein